jgi:ABC-type Fe3+ transport system permease subunit
MQTESLPARFGLRRTNPGRAPVGLAAASTVIAAAMLLPLAYLLLRAAGVGLEKALAEIFSLRTLIITWNSLLLAFLVTAISLAISLPLAWLTVRSDLPGRRIWSVLLALPLVIPTYVGAYALISMMGPRGIVQGWLAPLGVEQLPSIYGLVGATWALTIFSYPYLFLSLRAGLINMDPAQAEAARSLGLNPLQVFWRVTLPHLRPARLGWWAVPALIFAFLVVVAALLLPVGVVAYWLVRGVAAGESLLPVWVASVNSVYVSLLAAGAAVLLALPVVYYSVRFPSRYSGWTARAAFLGYALPGIVVALSLVFFGANYTPWLYQTIAMLVFAYTVRFLPQALGTVRTNLLQVSPRLEEAGRSLGLSRRWTIWRITLPLLRPGIWAGAALVFLTTIKELPVTLLLSPAGFTTLATQIWSASSEAFYARAAAPALLLVTVSALSIVVLLGQEEQGAG